MLILPIFLFIFIILTIVKQIRPISIAKSKLFFHITNMIQISNVLKFERVRAIDSTDFDRIARLAILGLLDRALVCMYVFVYCICVLCMVNVFRCCSSRTAQNSSQWHCFMLTAAVALAKKSNYSTIGHIILVSAINIVYKKRIKKGEMMPILVVRTRKNVLRNLERSQYCFCFMWLI